MSDTLRRRDFIKLAATAQGLVVTGCGGGSSTPTAPSASNPPPTAPPAPTSPTSPPTTPVSPPSNAPVGPLTEVRATVEGSELVVVVDGTTLAQLGGMARAEGSVSGLFRYVLLVRTANDRVVALNGICTHEGCVINRVATPAFECPCHGSQYDHGGNVLRGPAPAALPNLAVTFEGRVARIRFYQEGRRDLQEGRSHS